MPNSVKVGVRPSISRMRPYSSSFRLCSRTTSGVTGRSPGKGIARGDLEATPASAMSNLVLWAGLLPESAHQVIHDAEDEAFVVVRQDRPHLTVVEPGALAVLTGFELNTVKAPILEMTATLRAPHMMQATLGIAVSGFFLLPPALDALGIELREVFVFVLAGLVVMMVGHCFRGLGFHTGVLSCLKP